MAATEARCPVSWDQTPELYCRETVSGRSPTEQFCCGDRHARSSRRVSQESNEDRKCRTSRTRQHYGIVGHGSCAQVGKTHLSRRASLRKADGWNLKNQCHLTVAKHLREKTQPSLLNVTLRDGICSAVRKELVIIRDQAVERSVVVLALNEGSAIWKDSSLTALLRHVQLKYIDVERMRVVTDNRWVAEAIKSDKVKRNVATDGATFGNAGNFQEHRDGWSQHWRVGKSESSESDEEKKDREEEKLCMLIIKGLASYNRERNAKLANAQEEKINVSSALMTSQGRSCRGLKFAKIENMN